MNYKVFTCQSDGLDEIRRDVLRDHSYIKRWEEKYTETIVYDEHGDFSPDEEYHQMTGYLDVHSIDWSHGILSNNSHTKTIVAYDKGKYVGLIYLWVNGPYGSIVGVRKSPMSERKGVAKFLLSAVVNEARKSGCSHAVVLNPLGTVISTLQRMGFEKCKTHKGMLTDTPLDRSCIGHILSL